MNYFFYGTLLDGDVLARVTGRKFAKSQMIRAWVKGFRRVCVTGQTYPVLATEPSSRVEGILIRKITSLESALLSAYEGAYRPEEFKVVLDKGNIETAWVFTHAEIADPSMPAWNFDDWRRRHKRDWLTRI